MNALKKFECSSVLTRAFYDYFWKNEKKISHSIEEYELRSAPSTWTEPILKHCLKISRSRPTQLCH